MMNERTLKAAWVQSAAAVAISAVVAAWWGVRPALSVAAGGAWNLTSLWCLARVLRAWVGPSPSTRRAVTWIVLKFPLLYYVGFRLLSSHAISSAGFGLGFSIVLFVVLARLAVYAQQFTSPRTDGR